MHNTKLNRRITFVKRNRSLFLALLHFRLDSIDFVKYFLQKEEKIKDLNRRVQLKAQQRAKQHNSDSTMVTNTDQSQRGALSDDVIIVNNSIPASANRVLELKDKNQSEVPNVGTLVTIAANSPDSSHDNAFTKATAPPPSYNQANKLQSSRAAEDGLVMVGDSVVVRGSDNMVTISNTSPPSLGITDSGLGLAGNGNSITMDGNSDSALPAMSSTPTTKSSKTSASGSGDDAFSESYC